MKALIGTLCLLLLATATWAAADAFTRPAPSSGVVGRLDTQWGPDAFGYRARDSAEPGGPTYRWIDITAIGTQVTGLSDDNFVGPFPIGFNFRFYWYDVNQYWIGSNGYIKFSTAGQLAQPIPQFPNATAPNDIIGPYVADWFFGAPDPSVCYRWNNADTLIVMWANVTAWQQGGNTGNHNFELILSRVDSSITFMYGPQQGTVSNDNIAIGIENLTGQIGISNYYGAYPPPLSAIKFTYPRTITYQVHDMAVGGVQNEISGGFFIRVGDTLRPWMSVRNAGNQSEVSCVANYAVRRTNNQVVVQMDSTVGATVPSQVVSLLYPPLWVPNAAGLFRCVGTVTLAGDMNPGNNSIRSEAHVVTLPGELAYDDGGAEREWGWAGGNGGMAMQFEPPIYPCEVTRVRVFVQTAAPEGFEVRIYDDQGPNGGPGNLVWGEQVVNPAGGSWAAVDVRAGDVRIDSGAFYVAWWQTVEGISFGLDTTSSQGISRRTWEGAGGWGEFRLNQEADAMIRCSIRDLLPPNNPPGAFNRLQPVDSSLSTPVVNFRWSRSVDPNGDPVNYRLRFWSTDYPHLRDSTYQTTDTALTVTVPIPVEPLLTRYTFRWTVKAYDGRDSTAASNGQGIFYIEIDLGADDLTNGLPTEYALGTYPNPFNTTALISYAVPVAGRISLKVYNLMGEEVATLEDGVKAPGRYQIAWDAGALSTGMYFAVLSSPTATRIEKLMLLK